MSTRQIIALGGGGGLTELERLALDRYILAQVDPARGDRPRVGFLGAASGDADAGLTRFYAAYAGLECRPSHLPLFRRTPDVRAYLLSQDVIYVGGGNTKSMLAVWKEWGVAEVLHEAWHAGIVLSGGSAGAICWFEHGVTDSFADRLVAMPCLGFLAGSCCPHYDGEPERRPAYHTLLSGGEIEAGHAIDDGAAVHFVDGIVHRVVAARPGARAYRVRLVAGAVVEDALETARITEHLPTAPG
jgi:peptidase E